MTYSYLLTSGRAFRRRAEANLFIRNCSKLLNKITRQFNDRRGGITGRVQRELVAH